MRIGSGSNVDQSRRVDHALVPDGHELKSRELGHDRKDEFSAPRQVDARQLPLLPPDSGKPSLFEKGTRFVTEKALPVLGGLAGAGGLAAYLIGTGGLGIFVPLLLAGLAGGVGGKLASGILRWGNNKAFTLDEKAKAALLAHAKALGPFEHQLMQHLTDLPGSQRPDDLVAALARMKSGNLELQDILGKKYAGTQMNDTEKRLFNQQILPMVKLSKNPVATLKEILKGGYVEVNDNGHLYEQIKGLQGAYIRESSHQSVAPEFSAKLPALGAVLTGVSKGKDGKYRTWFQLEASPQWKALKKDPRQQFEGRWKMSPGAYEANPAFKTGILDWLKHDIRDFFFSYKLPTLVGMAKKNVGPFGRSVHHDQNAIQLEPANRRIKLGGDHAAYGNAFEDQNPLKNFGQFADMAELQPVLFNAYSRRNAQGDGSCWLTGMLYAGLDASLKDGKAFGALQGRLDGLKAAFIRAYPDHGEALLEEFRNLVNELRQMPEQRRAASMVEPANSGVLRRFSRELMAMKLREARAPAQDIADVLTPNAEGGPQELGALSEALGFNIYAVDASGRGGGKKYAIMNTVAGGGPVPTAQELARQGAKLLLYTGRHYSILEPTQK